MSDYVRDRWGVERGFPGGPVYAIGQTPDGYLWIGTEKGLVRFDGFNFDLFTHTNSTVVPAGPILNLMTDAEGNLWIQAKSKDLLRYRNGAFENITQAIDSARAGVTAMCRGPNGEAMFAVRGSGVFIYRSGQFDKLLLGPPWSNLLVLSMAKTGSGEVWLGTRDAGLFLMSGGELAAMTKGLPGRKVNCLLAAGDGGLWVGTDNGVVKWKGEEPASVPAADAFSHLQALALVRDRESNIWIGTGTGLLRLNASGVAALDEDSYESREAVSAVFEDREGNLWLGRGQGLERLRDSAFTTPSISSAHPSYGGAVYVDEQGRTWFAPTDGGLYWQKDGLVGQVRNDGLDDDVVYSLAGGGGELWVGRQRGGLTQLKYNGRSFTARTYREADGLPQNSIYAVYQCRDGAVWAGLISGGVTRFKDGKFTTYTAANGLTANTVTAILEGLDGTLWFGTANGLSSLSQNRWTVYGGLDGLPPGSVNCLLEDSYGAIWIGTDSGIAVLRSGQIEVPRDAPDSLQEAILGIAEDRDGQLWVSTSNHVLRVARDRLLGGVTGEAGVREFGLADGLRSVTGIKRHRPVFLDSLGQVWLSTSLGLSVVDPRRVERSSAPALARVEGVIADGSAVEMMDALHIPSARQRITFSYAGLSLTVPERVRFRYRLDGFDRDWSPPLATREAIYTNLSPGSYRFRVIASNSEGVWNGVEATIQLEIVPAFWQTWWFRLSSAALAAAAVLVFYRLRLRRLTNELNMRFEERLAERTRIAQDLHDKLLQGFLSASMQLDVAADRLEGDSPAKPLVSRVLELMRQVIEEGRAALKDLRTSRSAPRDLAEAFSRLPDELALQNGVDYRVTVEGEPRSLHSVIREEAYWVVREALVNAFLHSRANHIEVVMEYAPSQLRILVRDDGRGIEPQILRSGRDGHWGLRGMRERAEGVGARFKVWSRSGAGTGVELSIPADIAFEPLEVKRRRRPLAGRHLPKAKAEAEESRKRGA
ncbi:MAG: two-component regulator propeller domain-containing protein [Blastocatellia bacterium]